jgi:hypothetical protein
LASSASATSREQIKALVEGFATPLVDQKKE